MSANENEPKKKHRCHTPFEPACQHGLITVGNSWGYIRLLVPAFVMVTCGTGDAVIRAPGSAGKRCLVSWDYHGFK